MVFHGSFDRAITLLILSQLNNKSRSGEGI